MDKLSQVITGLEVPSETSLHYNALINFYTAFNNQNLKLMESNWLQTDEVSMSNPLGGIKRGWHDIREVYNKIFNGDANVYVEFYDYSIHSTEHMFLAVGHERGTLEINNKKIRLAIRTSRAYQLHKNQWK